MQPLSQRVSLLVLLVALSILALSCGSLGARKTLRIGTTDSAPYNFWDSKTDKATGFAVDVVNRAADIAGYRLQWVHSKTGPEASFKSGQVDFWPFVTVHEERRKEIYMTKPWWSTATVMLFREDLKISGMADLKDRNLVLTSPARRYVPALQMPSGTKIEVIDDPTTAFELMCQGKVDVAWLDYRIADGVLLNRPEKCLPMKLGSLILEDSARAFAIGSRLDRNEDADRLRDAVDSMGESGEIVDLATKWKLLHKVDSAFILWLNQTREKNVMLKGLFWGAVLILAVAVFFLQRLSHARKLAELSARARTQFLANMSHEIRTPMNGILGLAELTLATDLTAEQRDKLSMLQSSARSLLEILDDILDFSRIESGKLSLESIPFDLRDVANRSVQLLALAAREKSLTLTTRIDEKLPESLAGDPGRIQQVLINLLGNAVKFTARGQVELNLCATQATPESWNISFAVVDSGIGIAPEQQSRIFNAFTQADSTTTRRFGGTGLGLAISTQLVSMMGGKLAVASTPDVGSTFSFELEFREAKPVIAEHQEPAVPTRSLNLLVAEDNQVNSIILRRVLERAGHTVHTVANGRLALEALNNQSFNAVLMDVHMPEMDGLEATRRIRQLERQIGAHTPIIALTALALKGDAERCLEAGMDAYLSKPVNTSELFALLARLEEGSSTKIFSTS